MEKQKHLHRHVGHAIHALVLAVLFLWNGSAAAEVTGSGTTGDPYVIDGDGASLTIAGFASYYVKFTAPADGTLKVVFSDSPYVYTDETFSTKSEESFAFSGTYDPKYYTLGCTSGNTYYFGRDFVMNAGTMTVSFLTEAEPVELLSVSPSVEEPLNASTANISLRFNQGVNVSQCIMATGSSSASLTVNGNGRDYVSANASDKLVEWYADGTLNEGDEITFTFTNVKAGNDSGAVYGTDGTLALTYRAAAKPMTLVSSTNTPDSETPVRTFYSYYMTDDAAGNVTLTFSGDINTGSKPTVTLSYGDPETEDYYTETIEPQIYGNILFIDLKGRLRRAADMVSSGQLYDYIGLKVSGVKDSGGNYAYSTMQGSYGAYGFSYEYAEVNYVVKSDWTVDGSAVSQSAIGEDTRNIELWLGESGGNVAFTGAEFKYVSGGAEHTATIPKSGMTVTAESGETTVSIPVPNISIDAGSEVTVSLTGVERPDGLTEETYPSAMDKFTVTVSCTGRTAAEFFITGAVWHKSETEDVDMIDGTVDVLANGTTTTLTTNRDSEIGYATWEIRGNNNPDNEYVRSGYLTGPAENGFTIEWYGHGLDAGNTYTFTLKAWKSEADKNSGSDPNVGTATFTVNGAKEAYVYSDVTLLTDIGGGFELVSTTDISRTFEFSGAVTLTAVVNLGFGTSEECTVEAADNEGKAWRVTIPASVLDNYTRFQVNLFAKDTEGKAVNKTSNGAGTVMGSEDNTWFQVEFTSSLNLPDITVDPADGSTLESIGTVTFGYSEGINLLWGGTEGKITVYDKVNGTVMAEFTQDDVTVDYPDDWSAATICHVTLAEPVTEPGTYSVVVPADFFILGEGQTTYNNKATTVTYTIKAPAGELDVSIDPAEGTVAEIPATLTLWFTDMNVVGINDGKGVSLTDGNGTEYSVELAYDYNDWDNLNKLLVNLAEGAITADGVYTLTVMAGALNFNDDPDNVNAGDIVFTYTIMTETGIGSLVAAGGGKVDVYGLNGVLVLRDADAAAVRSLAKGLYIINGRKVALR